VHNGQGGSCGDATNQSVFEILNEKNHSDSSVPAINEEVSIIRPNRDRGSAGGAEAGGTHDAL